MALKGIVYICQEAGNKRPSIIEGRKFEDVLIEGPAILAPLEDVTMTHNSFDADPDSIFLAVPEGRSLVGVIGLKGVTFTRCEFRNVAIAGTAAAVAAWREGIAGGLQT